MSEVLVKTVSPKGPLVWVDIQGEGSENMSGKMQYKADVILEPLTNPEHLAYIDEVNKFWEANKPKGFKKAAKSLGYYLCDPLLDDNGEPMFNDEGSKIYDPKGRTSISFKTATKWPDGKTKKVKTRNSRGSLVELGELLIGNGSEGYLAGAMDIYVNKMKNGSIIDAGVTFYLDEIKITKFVEYAKSNPFGEDTDGADDDWTGEETDPFTGTDDAKPKL